MNDATVQVPQSAQTTQVVERVLVTPFQQRQAAGLVSNRPKDAWYISGYTFPTTDERVVRISVTSEGIDALEEQGDISPALAKLARAAYDRNEKFRPADGSTALPVPGMSAEEVERLLAEAYQEGLKEGAAQKKTPGKKNVDKAEK